MNKNFEFELPDGYKEAKVVDAKNKKTSVLFTVFSFVITALVFAIGFLIRNLIVDVKVTSFDRTRLIIEYAIFLVVMIGYIILHELTHGIAYKILTKQKLTFSLTLTVAYCGVPNIYVYRKAALISLLAPFVVFNIVFLVPLFIIKETFAFVLALIIFSIHVGGCVGDLYDTYLYLFKFKDNRTLMRDTGPKQTFYVLEEEGKNE